MNDTMTFSCGTYLETREKHHVCQTYETRLLWFRVNKSCQNNATGFIYLILMFFSVVIVLSIIFVRTKHNSACVQYENTTSHTAGSHICCSLYCLYLPH